ncbi:MAG: DNA polymerase III subunit delta [Muribaculaceae bacterium]|nr:DNA polymerase III subunit delta [Muribaculaceae bacterium]MDE6316729.1 DNA polymerase III subunit delta [Muribaculaceae bacterium]
MKFSDIPGHDTAKSRLRAMADSGHLPHALLISSPEGAGEMMLARAFVQYLHCTDRTPDGDSCGRCPSCIQHHSFNHVDTHFVFPVLKKKSGGPTLSDDYMPEWRRMLTENQWMDSRAWPEMLGKPDGQPRIYVDDADELRRKLSFTARVSQHKVALIWLPEKLMEAAANKLLKLLEEPAEDVVFVLVSNNPGRILPTIYSRTQRLELRRLSDAAVASVLMDLYDVGQADAMAVAHNAEGNVSIAATAMRSAETNGRFLELFISLMRLAYGRKVAELKTWSEKVAELGRDSESRFLCYCERMVRENFILNLRQPGLNYLDSAEQAFSARFCPFINAKNVEKMIAELERARIDIEGNGNAKIVLFDMAIQIIMLLRL